MFIYNIDYFNLRLNEMFYCKVKECTHPEYENHECYTPEGRCCENMVFGCPKCHGNSHQEISGDYSFIVCDNCKYTEFDD
jgi:hypothetical protein